METWTAGRPFARLVLRNARCLREATLEFDPRLTVVIGENGSGKTTVVEALASLSFGEGEGLREFPLSKGARSGEIALYETGARRPAARWTAKGGGLARRLPEDRYLLAYGRYRRVLFPPEPGAPAVSPLDPTLDLGALAQRAARDSKVSVFRPDHHLLRDLSRYLAALHAARQSEPRVERVWNRLDASLRELGQGIEGIVMERGATAYVPMVLRHGVRLELRELSDGYQAILVVVFDLVLRYLYLFPTLDDPLQGAAMVAIDEVDLHLHPRWQRTVAGQLTALFPNTQFLLTTHSPAVVQGAIDQKRQVVTLREEGGGATARALTDKEKKELEGAEIGSVLLEERLFGIDSRYSPRFEGVEQQVAEIQSRIARGTASEEDRRRLFADLETLQRLVARDEVRRADGAFVSQLSELRIALLADLAAEIERARS
jgi:energy-coupling factor transporter ATP-binding protein EcfA2